MIDKSIYVCIYVKVETVSTWHFDINDGSIYYQAANMILIYTIEASQNVRILTVATYTNYWLSIGLI